MTIEFCTTFLVLHLAIDSIIFIGCFCPDDMVLHEDECIPSRECPPIVELPEECPEGQVFNECGSACPLTCDDPPPFCTFQCVRGKYS